MKSVIYYFTGSGYSFKAARDLSGMLGAELAAIRHFINTPPELSDVEVVGIVFPVYHASFGLSGIPFIVEHFINRLSGLEDKYIFAVCMHGGKPGTVLRNLEKLVERRGGKLAYGSCVRLSVLYKTDEKIKSVFLGEPLPGSAAADADEADRLYSEWTDLCSRIAFRVNERKVCVMVEGYEPKFLSSVRTILQLKIAKTRYRQLSDSESESFEALVNSSDAGFRVSGECNGCGLCEKLCPVNDIILENSAPKWLGRCENCFACYHWCPMHAIGGPLTEFEKALTPDGVTADDLL